MGPMMTPCDGGPTEIEISLMCNLHGLLVCMPGSLLFRPGYVVVHMPCHIEDELEVLFLTYVMGCSFELCEFIRKSESSLR